METDPVCGMDIPASSSIKMKYEGKWYFFCSDDCREEFKAGPEMYAEYTD